jgi:hypothetical protein
LPRLLRHRGSSLAAACWPAILQASPHQDASEEKDRQPNRTPGWSRYATALHPGPPADATRHDRAEQQTNEPEHDAGRTRDQREEERCDQHRHRHVCDVSTSACRILGAAHLDCPTSLPLSSERRCGAGRLQGLVGRRSFTTMQAFKRRSGMIGIACSHGCAESSCRPNSGRTRNAGACSSTACW